MGKKLSLKLSFFNIYFLVSDWKWKAKVIAPQARVQQAASHGRRVFIILILQITKFKFLGTMTQQNRTTPSKHV